MANIIVADSLKPSGRNKPLDVRTVVNTESEILQIPVPFVGMIVYVKDTEKYYSIKSLKASAIGIENSAVERYEPLTTGNGASDSEVQNTFKKDIKIGDWSSSADSDGFYSIDIKHDLNSESIQVSVIDTDAKTNVLEVFTIVDANNIKLMNDEKINCKVAIK